MKMYKSTYATAVNWLHTHYIPFDIFSHDEDFASLRDDVYTAYITDASNREVFALRELFPDSLWFKHSQKFNKWILLVDHCGRPWNHVSVQTTERKAARKLGCKPTERLTEEEIDALAFEKAGV